MGVAFTAELTAQNGAITYQGLLADQNRPTAGIYDLRFGLYDATSGGSLLGSVTNHGTVVVDGLFTATLNFGPEVFDGHARWLEISAATNGVATFQTLSPRQPLTATPYAIRALSMAEAAIGGEYSNAVSFSNGANEFTGTFTGDGSSLSNINVTTLGGMTASSFWQLSGNAATTPGVNYLGTSDARPLEFRVNKEIGFRIEYPSAVSLTNAGIVPNLIGGYGGNSVGIGTSGGVIAGGGGPASPNTLGTNSGFSAIGGGGDNHIADNSLTAIIAGGYFNAIGERAHLSSIGGGSFNTIADGATQATIAGGYLNTIGQGTTESVIGGGSVNEIAAGASFGTISGGEQNQIASNSVHSSIGGGANNLVAADSWYSTVGGGRNNLIASNSTTATIGGGQSNELGVGADFSVIGGGYDNNIRSNSAYATIAGGHFNRINNESSYSAIGGGGNNHIQANSEFSTIAGGIWQFISINAGYSGIGFGSGNSIHANSGYATIAGGDRNEIAFDADYTTIGGGSFNTINSNSHHVVISGGANNFAERNNTTIGGGFGNQVAADFATIAGGRNSVVTGVDATVGGGSNNEVNTTGGTISGGINNLIAISSPWATISGGYGNTATGTGSVIGGGNGNSTTNSYSTVGGGDANVASKQFATVPGGARNTADGNYAFAAGRRAKANHTGAFVWGDSSDADVVSTNNNSVTLRASGGYRLFSNGALSAGVFLGAGDNSWASISDRYAKKNFQPADGREILDKLVQVPIHRWNYKSEAEGDVPHLGPMAQDFKAAFYPGRDDKSITTLEFDGVALAAIQGLNEKVEHKAQHAARRIKELETENAALQARLESVEGILKRLLETSSNLAGNP